MIDKLNLIFLCWLLIIVNLSQKNDAFIKDLVTKNSKDLTNVSTILQLPRSAKSIDSQGKLSLANTNNNKHEYEYVYKSFRINKNSIIKTHDSRSLGAKYLNETELSSNEDCMLWCWNTTNCNLAVFEEKTRGSCYLFDCGSIQDFKCRFASHTFYTSSILQINKNSFLLNDWKSQDSQENDLVGLKEKQLSSNRLDGDYRMKNEVLPQIQTADVLQQNKLETTTTSLKKVSKCRQYQFECLNNSECIGIYNVCDGIAQCADGSDEALELECHKSRLNMNNNSNKNYLENNGGGRISISSDLKDSKDQSNRIVSPGNYISGFPNNQMNTQFKSIKYSSNGNLNYNYPKSPNEKQIFEENTYRNHIQMNGGDYNGYNIFPNWNQYSIPVEKQLDKISILTNEPDNQYNNAIKESIYRPSFKYQPNVENFMQSYSSSLSNPTNDIAYNVPNSMNDVGRPRMDYPFPSQYRITQPPMNPLINDMKSHSDSRIMLNVSNLGNQTETSIIGNLNHGQQTQINKTTSKVNYSYISNNEKISIKSPNIVAISYMHDTTTQNGRETNSAVIALTLGLFITCILIIIVGCRMKSFKKRIARRGRSLAHDADYLINGMYL